MELSGSSIKKFLIFSQNKFFFIFQEMETPKKLLIFFKESFSCISGNGNPEANPYVSGKGIFLHFKSNFQSSKNKKKNPLLTRRNKKR